MDIAEYIQRNKEVNNLLLSFIDTQFTFDDDYQNLMNVLDNQNIFNNSHELFLLLQLVLAISKNHYRCSNFFDKIEKFLLHIKDNIKQFYTNREIFNLFKAHKRILLFLFKEKIIALDQSIIEFLLNNQSYYQYFFIELHPFIDNEKKESIEKELIQLNSNIFENFEEKRKIGENDSYICQLIRNDSIKDFVTYVNQTNFPLFSKVKQSFFETNSFLIKKKDTTLIEYSAFFGSIQIFQYLKLNGVKLTPSLWLYAIHGRNSELIYLLEQNQVVPGDYSYEQCLKESIKCHHNEISNYIQDMLLNQETESFHNNLLAYCFHYYNYEFFPNEFNNKFIFFYACKYNYIEILKFLLQTKKFNINETVVW